MSAGFCDTRAGVVYDGNSQGGILGGVLVAVSPDVKRGVLGVTAMNYSILLNRSVDFTALQPALEPGLTPGQRARREPAMRNIAAMRNGQAPGNARIHMPPGRETRPPSRRPERHYQRADRSSDQHHPAPDHGLVSALLPALSRYARRPEAYIPLTIGAWRRDGQAKIKDLYYSERTVVPELGPVLLCRWRMVDHRGLTAAVVAAP